MIDRLEREGLVARERDLVDRRVIRVRITAEGRITAEAGRDAVAELEERAFATLSADERQALADLLGRVLDGLPETGATP